MSLLAVPPQCGLRSRALGDVSQGAGVAARGAASWYRTSSRARRGFCDRCGTSLFFESLAAPDEIDVAVAVLRESDVPPPTHHIWVLDRAPWTDETSLRDGLPCHLADSGSVPFDPSLGVREERAGEAAVVRRVHELGFGRSSEAALVDALRAAGVLSLSLVAEREGAIVGHVAFSPVALEPKPASAGSLLGLGPVAVVPEHQRRGIGVQLIGEALARLRRAGHDAVFVLGDPAYYARLGFVPARELGIAWEHDAPADAFRALELQPRALADSPGTVRYHPEFAAVG